MFEILFWFSVGLLVGWNVLPQPTWVKSLYTGAVDTVKSWFD